MALKREGRLNIDVIMELGGLSIIFFFTLAQVHALGFPNVTIGGEVNTMFSIFLVIFNGNSNYFLRKKYQTFIDRTTNALSSSN